MLGCGPIAQLAHFDATRKAHNADLYAICDLSDDLRAAMAAVHCPEKVYSDYGEMLADPNVDAVIVAAADQFHVDLCKMALAAGKHVLVEKPLGVTVEECEELAAVVRDSGKVLQVGNNRRFDPGVAFARDFIQAELSERLSLKCWYWDSTYRYTMTGNLQPVVRVSSSARRPEGDPKADKRRYFMLTHGSHLVDTARYLGGEITSVRARLVERFGAFCWFVYVSYADGSMGLLDLTIAVRGDFEEGFQIHGEGGSVKGKVFLPWYHRAAEVECFSVKDRQFHRPLGEDAYTYKLQIESFAEAILTGAPMRGATVEDGLASMRAMVAIAESVRTGDEVALAKASGGV